MHAIVPVDLRGVVLAARGSSDNAAMWARYALELATGRPVVLAAPSLVTRYGARTDHRGWLVIAVSQSGGTPEITTVLEAAARTGAATLAVTNQADSPLARAAHAVLALDAGPERAVPATKTVTASFAVLAAVAEALGPVPWDAADWSRLPGAVAAALRAPAIDIGDPSTVLTVGRGFLYAAAKEAALKLRETTGVVAEAWSAADLLHGPIAATGAHQPVLLFAAPGPVHDDMAELRDRLLDRSATVIDVPVSHAVPEALAAIEAVVHGQAIALAAARDRGLETDLPFGLTKVTATT